MKMKSRLLTVAILCCALVSAFALAGCGSSSDTKKTETPKDTTELSIFAANSLQKALPEVQALYTEQHPEVTFADTQFEASGTLVQKLSQGGAADILITASAKTMDNAATAGTIDESTRVDMFKNDLVICTAEGADLQINSVDELATNPAITSIAIGDPNTVPAGKYALQTLQSAGLVTYVEDEAGTVSDVVWADSISAKINAGADKVGTVASYVKEGTCTVGFVYTSDIYRYDGIQTAFTTPADSHKVIKYPGSVVMSSQKADQAKSFIDFCLTDADAQKIFSQYGFELV